MEIEKFSFVKFFSSFFQVLPWVKTLSIGLKLLGIAFIGLTIYRAYFVKTTQQTQRIIVQKGATAIVQQKQEAPKRKFIPFVEGSVEQKANTDFNTGVRAGLRFEF